MFVRGDRVIKVVIPTPNTIDCAPAGGPFTVGETMPRWPEGASMAHKIKDGCHPLRTQDHRLGIGVWDCSCRYRLYNPPAPELIQRHTERPRLEPVDE